MKAPILATDGKTWKSTELDPEIFSGPVRPALVHAAVLAHLAAARQGTASTKDRSDVSGGGRKPWRQKGTGRARAGTNRSPLWRGGGVTFGPKPRGFRQRLTRQERRLALRGALIDRAKEERIRILPHVEFSDGKTRSAAAWIDQLDINGSVLIVFNEPSTMTYRAFRNLRHVTLTTAANVHTYEVMSHVWCLVEEDAVTHLAKRLHSSNATNTTATA